MAAQADQVCQACNAPVHKQDRWVTVNRLAFHDKCFKCVKCAKPMTMHSYADNPEGKLICTGCHFGMRPARVFTSIYGAVPTSATGAAGGTAGRCARCDAPANAVLAPALGKGNLYCLKCFVCNNCALPIDRHQCFELLDELYCNDCEVVYANRRYLVAKMGSGPVVPL